jgi:peptide-methionine (S)-S-oxide reductase
LCFSSDTLAHNHNHAHLDQDKEHKMSQAIAIIAGGCFWCTEAVFADVIGVSHIESGYIGGQLAEPSYQQICTGTTGHAEAIKLTYDLTQISYADVLDMFFATHDPTTLNRQGNDIGTQYRSAIFPLDAEQTAEAQAAITRAQTDHAQPIVTTIEAASQWWPAEPYHQQYWSGEGQRNPYCLAIIPPKLQKLRKSFANRVRQMSVG